MYSGFFLWWLYYDFSDLCIEDKQERRLKFFLEDSVYFDSYTWCLRVKMEYSSAFVFLIPVTAGLLLIWLLTRKKVFVKVVVGLWVMVLLISYFHSIYLKAKNSSARVGNRSHVGVVTGAPGSHI